MTAVILNNKENIDKLQARAVAYLNTDTCASGPMLYIGATPLMKDIFYDVSKLVQGVVDSSKTLFGEWKEYSQRLKPNASEHSTFDDLGAGSDHAPFTSYADINAADIWFRRDEVKYNITIYPAYHTGYETFYMVTSYIDPEFKIHQGCGRLASLALKYLADSTILPYSIRRFPQIMLENLEKSNNRDTFIQIYDKYEELENSMKKLAEAVTTFEDKLKEAPQMSPLQVRALNDQMMKLEQIFILPLGLPGRPSVRNSAFSTSQFDNYASDGFPGLGDLRFRYEGLESEEKMEREKMIKRHISDLTIMADRAASFL